MSIKEFTVEELENELKRRQAIKESEWPKSFNLVLSHEASEDEKLVDFLEDQCDILEGSEEFERVFESLQDIHLSCLVYNNGSTEIIGVNLDGKSATIISKAEECAEVKRT